jgi:septal ring factor EnvC (AmiA/AmiB activator)
MTAKQTTLKEVGEMVARVVEHMATKEDIERLDKRIGQLDDRIGKVDAKIDRLDTKLSKFEDSEIDKRKQLEVRVAATEKHLGLDKKIAA